MNELEEIEEIINKLDELSLDVWTKKDNETEEEFEKRIENLEEELEEELIDVISDSIVNEQKINEDEAIKEAKEKIEKEYEIYKDAFEQDGNGKIKLKSRDELEKLDYKSNEEIEKLNAIAKNYNDPDSYIDEIKNSINEKKDVDAEIERKLEIAKAYISAKIRGEEAVVSTNDIKSKKYEDNNDYIKKSNQLNRVPLVQNEMIFNNKLISQSYVPFVPNTNYNVIQTNNAQTGTVLINKPQNTITNPTKVQVLKNIENKMDNSNDLTKQKIKARAELKIIFKEIEGKELTEAENNDLKQKIKEVEKKYPNTITDKTITKLCDNFRVKLPEENIQNMPNQIITQSTKNDEENKKIEDSDSKSDVQEEKERTADKIRKKAEGIKASILGVGGALESLKQKGNNKLKSISKGRKEKTSVLEQLQQLSKENEKNMQSAKQNLQKINQSINKSTTNEQQNTIQKSVKPLKVENNQNNPTREIISNHEIRQKEKVYNIIKKIASNKQFNNYKLSNLICYEDYFHIAKYLEKNDDKIVKDFFDKLISSFDEFVENDFTSNFDDTNEYVDIKVLDDILKKYQKGFKGRDVSKFIIEKDKDKEKQYLTKELLYINYLKRRIELKTDNPIENLKNEVRFGQAIDKAEHTTITKVIPELNLMIKLEKAKRYNKSYSRHKLFSEIKNYEEKIMDNQKVSIAVLNTLGEIYYNGIQATNGETIIKPNKLKAKEIYEKIVLENNNSQNEIAYSNLYHLFSDNKLPTYDIKQAEIIRNIMEQKGIKLETNNDDTTIDISNVNKPCSFVCSDIHGEYNAYKTIINRLGENDKLYILGDVIDRGEDGIKILQDIINRQEKGQVEFLMGNHELMMLQTILGNEECKENWFKGNGGEATYRDYKKLPLEEQIKIKDFLLNTNIYKQINENNQDYYLVHAKAIQDEEKNSQTYKEMMEQGLENKINEALWTRVGTDEDECMDYEIAKKDVFTIIGHTPVNNSLIKFKLGYVDIDCGISYDEQVALVNLTDGTVEYFSGESIKEKSKEKENNNEER